MTTQYIVTISVMLVTLVLLVVLPKLLPKGPKNPTELTPRLKKRIVQASQNVGVEDTAKFYELSPRTVRRLRVFAGVERKSCGTCEHFDLKKGALAIQSNSIIKAVTDNLTPAQYGVDKMNSQSWADFGGCMVRPGVLMGSTDWCGTDVHAEKMKGDLWA